jgi:hypothetical protein
MVTQRSYDGITVILDEIFEIIQVHYVKELEHNTVKSVVNVWLSLRISRPTESNSLYKAAPLQL